MRLDIVRRVPVEVLLFSVILSCECDSLVTARRVFQKHMCLVQHWMRV